MIIFIKYGSFFPGLNKLGEAPWDSTKRYVNVDKVFIKTVTHHGYKQRRYVGMRSGRSSN